MAIDHGITTYAKLSPKKPSQSLRPEPRSKPRDVEERFGNVTDYRLMWTGGWMEGVVSDDDAHLPLDEREKMLIPRVVKAPFEPHINEKGDLKVYFDKGFCLLEDAPEEIQKAWKKAGRRKLQGSSINAPLNPQTWEKQQKAKKEVKALEAEAAAQEAQIKAEQAKEKVATDKDTAVGNS